MSTDDPLMEMLLVEWPNTHLPELYAIFGKEAFISFINIFAGLRVYVPTREEIEDATKNHLMYKKWKEESITVRTLAEMYGLEEDKVQLILNKLEKKYGKLWIKND